MSKTNPTRTERREIERIKMMNINTNSIKVDNDPEFIYVFLSVATAFLAFIIAIWIIVFARIIAYFLGL